MAKGLWPVINVSSVEKSTEFYKGLGLRARIDDMDGLPVGTVDLGESGLIIWGKDNVAPDQAADTRAWLSGELGKGVLFTVGVPNARKTWEKAQAMRVRVDTPLEAQPWGGFGFNIVDLDGYVLNFSDKFPGMSLKPKAKPKPKARSAVGKKKAAGKKR